MSEIAWQTIRISYHDPRRDSLLLDGVRPAVQRRRDSGDVVRYYVEPHWRRGPHLRLHLGVAAGRAEAVVPDIVRELREYVAGNPSTSSWSVDTYRARQSSLATFEMAAPTSDVVPDNTVMPEADDDRTDFWGGPEILELARRFFSDTADPVMGWLDETRDGEGRHELALRIMIGMGHLLEPRLVHSHLSYRAHAEGCCAVAGMGELLRRSFEASYQQHRAELHALLRRMTAVPPGEAGLPDPRLADYLRASRLIRDEVLAGLRAGDFRPPSGDDLGDMSRSLGTVPAQEFRALAERNEFLAILMAPEWVQFRDHNPDFLCLRIMINFCYRTLLQLGIKPLERYHFCWLVSRSVEDVLGVPSIELVRTADLPDELVPQAQG